MRQAVLFILGVLFVLCGTVYAAVDLEEGVNQLQNGDFEQGVLAPWTMSQQEGATGVIELDDKEMHSGEFSLMVTTTAINGTNWHFKFSQTNLSFEADEKHTVKFWAIAEAPRVVQLCLQRNADPWDGWLWLDFNITEDWQEFVHEITMPLEDNDKGHFLAFHSGQSTDIWWLDDVRYYRGGADDEVVEEEQPQIAVDPVGKASTVWGGIKGNYR